MPQTVRRCSPSLGITLEGGRTCFYPGETITGTVRRALPTVCAEAKVHVTFLGRTKSLLESSDIWYRGRFTLFERTQMAFRGPIHIPPGHNSFKEWRFSVQIPETVDGSQFPGAYTPKPSFLSLDRSTVDVLPLPASFHSRGDEPRAFVEYYLEATIWCGRKGGGTAKLPVRIVTSGPPVADFKLRRYIALVFNVASQRLVPGLEEAELTAMEKIKKMLGTSSVPRFAFKFEVAVPTVLQCDNTTIPFKMRVVPHWPNTSEIIQYIPQNVWLVKFVAKIEARVDIKCERARGEDINTQWKEKVLLSTNGGATGSSKEPRQLVQIPCSSNKSPVDVGRALNLRLSHSHTVPGVECPSFTTFNIKLTHRILWSAKCEIARQKFNLSGAQDITLLPASKRLSNNEEKDDSWIRPPDVGEKLPSFAEVQREDRKMEPRMK